MNLPNFDSMTTEELHRRRDQHWAMAEFTCAHQEDKWHMDMVKEYGKEIIRRLEADASAVTRLSGALNDVMLELKRLEQKDTTSRYALVRACAAILGEIERMDRLT